MKKSVRTIFIIILLIFGIYLLYQYFQSDIAPDQSRNFYKSRSLLAQAQDEEITLSAQPVSEVIKHDEVNSKDAWNKLLSRLKALQAISAECEKKIAKLIPRQDIIDSEGKFFSNKDESIEQFSIVLKNIDDRDQVRDLFKDFGEYLRSQETINASEFNDFLTNILICRKENISIYLESLFEAITLKDWDGESRNLVHQLLLEKIVVSLDVDKLPDNLLYHLNLLRILGMSTKQDESYYSEIDSIYSRLADFEDKFFDDNERGVIYSPVQKYDDYINEMDYLADEMKYIIRRRFQKSFESSN